MKSTSKKQVDSVKSDFDKIRDAVREIGQLGRSLQRSGLTQKAVIVLLAHDTKLNQGVVKQVLDALPDLPRWALAKDVQ